MKRYFPQLPKSSLASHNQSNQEENANQSEVALHSSQMTSYQVKHKYTFLLTSSIDVVRLLINQGITFGGHDESESSLDNDERAKAMGYLRTCQTFKVAFMLHLMRDVLEITDELSKSLQKKEHDIANAMLFLEKAKTMLQKLRDNGWESLIDKVSAFCTMYDILIPNFDEPYVDSGRSRCRPAYCNVLHHYRVKVLYKIVDWQLQELKGRFDKMTIDLLHGVSCLNPINSFSSFDIRKIMRMAELYPDDFHEYNMNALENQLATYIIDVRDIDQRFSNLSGLSDLSRKLVQTKKHLNYSLVFLLVKLGLLLPVVTASIERDFSAMRFIKNGMLDRSNDELFSGCFVPYVEREVFNTISNDVIIKTIKEIKSRRVEL
ncbi:uncharacterized protein LOC107812211 [Nicotiana tabacum]|uniref:Uncharacterized protein LOC107812211 n=1 Tax=Nicotiana tabacum TaxID=4097 RepID=A0A1S4BV86_TOBAC|nr:uncharacterized protein LOC104114466 [Nicotiana tomentosiformis]XP_016492743.1 PREDICTED: uncharacterized protein LOC107812211 [Nicotiana tabacum]